MDFKEAVILNIQGGNGDKEELKENWKEEKENQENIIVENNNNTDKNKETTQSLWRRL